MSDRNFPARLTTLLFVLSLLMTEATWARQYKSRVFTDSTQDLSSSEIKNLADLEAAFASYQDDYQIASTGQYLAREMAANGDYEKATDYYYAALKSGGSGATQESTTLAQPVLKQLRRELAQVLLLLKRNDEVLALFFNGSPVSQQSQIQQVLTFDEEVLVARAYLALQQFHQVVTRLQPVTQQLAPLTSIQLQQLSGLLYQANAFALVVEVLKEIRKRNPTDVNTARQLTGLHIRLEQYQQALDLWAFVYAQGLLSQKTSSLPQETDTQNATAQDLLLLADLYHRQKAPEKAARLLQQSMDDGIVVANADNSYRLFEFWYQAKEISQAKDALWQSIQQSQNLQHALILAELLQQDQQWQQLESLILLSCDTILPDKFVGRINLFYGIALQKLGKTQDARRAFINASLVSGVKNQAREWLAFTGAAPASIEESQRLWGPCLPDDPDIELPKDLTPQPKEAITAKKESAKENQHQTQSAVAAPPITESKLTELAATRLYAGRLTTTTENLQRDIKTKVFTLLKNLMRSGGRVDGKMHLLFTLDAPTDTTNTGSNTGSALKLNIGFPYSGLPKTRAGFKIIKHAKRKALVSYFQGPATELAIQWQVLVRQALTQGLTPTGDAVMVFESDTSGSDLLDVQLQLIVE